MTWLRRIVGSRQKVSVPRDQLSEARRRLPINMISNITWLVLNSMVGFWYTPFLIDNLGVAVYGLVPLANTFVSYMAALTVGLDQAIGRFLAVDLNKGDTEAANSTFNTAIYGTLFVILLLFPVVLGITWLAPQLFDIPLGHKTDARWLIFLTGFSFLLTTFSGGFAVSSYAYHRFDLRLLLNIVRLLLRVASLIILFYVFSPHLWQIGVGLLLSALLFLSGHIILWKRLTPQLRFDLRLYVPARLKQLLGFGGWILINQVGALLFLNIDLILANLFFGAEVAGRYGAVLVFPVLLRTLVSVIDGVITPVLLTLYAQEDIQKMTRFVRLLVRFIGLLLALPVGLLCGLSAPLLTLWLGPEFADLALLVIISVGHLCINVAVVPLFSLQVTTNHVRLPAVITLTMGIANFIFAVILSIRTNLGYIGIAIAGAIMLTAKNGVFTPIYNARILDLPWWVFWSDLIAGVVGSLGLGVIAYVISLLWSVNGWKQIIFLGIILTLIYVVLVYYVGLRKQDRILLLSEVKRRFAR